MRKLINTITESLDQNFDYSSQERFIETFREWAKNHPVEAQKLIDRCKEQFNPASPPDGWIELYHGTPKPHAKNIKQNGFQHVKGQRSGFMGSIKSVDNLGVFLTNDKRMAHYFGNNRMDYGQGYEVIRTFVNPHGLTTFEKLPSWIKNIGLNILEDWDGKIRKTIPQVYQWWLLDHPEFINALREDGITGIIFRETIGVRRSAGSLGALTYFILDPTSIRVTRTTTMHDFYEWMKAR